MKKCILHIMVLLFVFLVYSSAFGAIINVPTPAYTTIQAGIDAASEGDTVLVADGIYTGDGNKNLDFHGKNIILKSENGPENTIIDCETYGRGFYFHSGESAEAVVDGFTIQNGFNEDTWPDDPCFPSEEGGCEGGGMYIYQSSPTITNCNFMRNAWDGGAIDAYESSSTITNCNFTENGGFSGYAIGSNLSSLTIANCNFNENGWWDSGAGAILSGSSSLIITECTFSGNISDGSGCAIKNWESSLTLTNSVFSQNYVDTDPGGAIAYGSDTITNCTFSGNFAEQGGGAISDFSGSITNCTFTGNLATSITDSSGGALYISSSSNTVTNSIFWNNYSSNAHEIYIDEGVSPTITYCDIDQDGYEGIDGNIRQNPLFVDPGYGEENEGDYHLHPDSPCIDAGDPFAPALPLFDLEGYPRIVGQAPDMGAYEFATDTDGDGIPDDQDECPSSDLSPTVVIDGCDSGVPNSLFDDGCTISDKIAELASGSTSHGKFTKAVAHYTNYLKRDGVITGQEKGAIQRCAGKGMTRGRRRLWAHRSARIREGHALDTFAAW